VTFGAFAFTEPLLGVGDTRTPMYLMGALVLDLFLIFDWGPFPRRRGRLVVVPRQLSERETAIQNLTFKTQL